MVLEESIDILKDVNLLKNDYVSINNIKISRVAIGCTMHEEYGIIIPVSSLIDLETCTVKIINVLSSLGTNSTEFKYLIAVSYTHLTLPTIYSV